MANYKTSTRQTQEKYLINAQHNSQKRSEIYIWFSTYISQQ